MTALRHAPWSHLKSASSCLCRSTRPLLPHRNRHALYYSTDPGSEIIKKAQKSPTSPSKPVSQPGATILNASRQDPPAPARPAGQNAHSNSSANLQQSLNGAQGTKAGGQPGPPRATTVWAPKTRLAIGVVFISALIYSMATGEVQQTEAPSIAERDVLSKRESGVNSTSPMRLRMEAFIKHKQEEIVRALEKIEVESNGSTTSNNRFQIDKWDRANGGGGITCVLQDGNVFEKAGVNTSIVYGTLPRSAISKMRVNHKALDPDVESLEFFAAGLSLVLHPHNPMAPTVHLNYRYFETANADGTPNAWWFGGGTDLTPSYLFDEDVISFHRVIKDACDKHDKGYYPRFKKWCDEYFFVKHRGESRGVGGIFFDDLDDHEKDQESLFSFVQGCADAFLPSYLPILHKRMDMPYTEKEKQWQQLRRGRYVEFNLVHDRGTSFGLNTPGARIESILMSLPLTARWQYMHEPGKGSREERLLNALRTPVDWV